MLVRYQYELFEAPFRGAAMPAFADDNAPDKVAFALAARGEQALFRVGSTGSTPIDVTEDTLTSGGPRARHPRAKILSADGLDIWRTEQ
jgi:hypothetical protein